MYLVTNQYFSMAGIGNDPRENRKFNMIKQSVDYDPNGDYVRTWIPELEPLKGKILRASTRNHPIAILAFWHLTPCEQKGSAKWR